MPARCTALKVFVVSNSPIAVPRDLLVGGPPDAKPWTTFTGGPLVERTVGNVYVGHNIHA
jgi:hypothetical protein